MGTRTPEDASADPPARSRWRRVARDLVVVLVTLVLLELGFRGLGPVLGVDTQKIERMRGFADTRSGEFEPHAFTVLTLRRDREDVNERGFRDRSWDPEAAEGVTRIACLGASTTYGYRVDDWRDAYPHQLEQALRERGHAVEVQNFGVPSWTTAETLVNYFLNVQDFAPDVVIVHHGFSDLRAQSVPGFRMDYSHFRRPWREPRRNWFERQLIAGSDLYVWFWSRYWIESVRDAVEEVGVVEPGTGDPSAYRRNLRTICEHVALRGGRPVLLTMPHHPALVERWPDTVEALRQQNDVMRELAEDPSVALVDLAREWTGPDVAGEWFTDLVHTTAEGQRRKAQSVAGAAVDGGWLR